MSRMTKKQREELRKKEIERKRENLKRTYNAYLLYHRYKNITWIAENDIRRKSAKIIVNNYFSQCLVELSIVVKKSQRDIKYGAIR